MFSRRIELWIPAAALVAELCLAALPAQAENEAPWYEAQTAYSYLYAQTSPERAAEIARSLDLFRAMFELLGPGLSVDSPVPTGIFAFRDAEAFAPYRTVADGDGLRVMGQMVAHRDANYILLDAGAPVGDSTSVVFHEYVHYLVRHNFPGVPRWFNEGLAEYYSTFAIEGERAVVGRPVARHLRWLARHELDLGDVFASRLDMRSRHGVREVGNFYAGSWALVHYLLSGGEERATGMGEFLGRIADGADPRDAVEETFGLRLSRLEEAVQSTVARGDFPVVSISVTDLESSLRAPKLAPMSRSRIDAALAGMSAHLGRLELAEVHADRALAADGLLGSAYGVLARVRGEQSRTEEAEQLYRQAIAAGSESALTYLDYARHLLAEPLDRVAESERASLLEQVWHWLDEAERRAPSFAEVDAVRGFSYLLADGPIEPGLAALERAIARMPERMDIVLHQAQLWMKAARFDEAERIIESTLARYADDDLLAAAREELERRRLLYAANAALAEGDLAGGIKLLDRAISITSDPNVAERMEMQLLELQRGTRVRPRR